MYCLQPVSPLSSPDIEVANRHGHTCLMIACYKGHYKIAKYLIEIGADVNRKSVKGNTALHDCAESGSLDIMKLLLSSGARIDVDAYGMTPLLAASVTGGKERLSEANSSLPQPLLRSPSHRGAPHQPERPRGQAGEDRRFRAAWGHLC